MDVLTIVLLGHTGVGKSATGNTILGRKAFESRRAFRSVTTEVSRQAGQVGRWPVCVVDTPGIRGNEEAIRTLCEELLQSNSPLLFLLVLKIDRFTQEQHCALTAALDAVGGGGRARTFLLFAGEDMLDNMTLEEFIHEDPDSPLPEQVKHFHHRYHGFNNKHGGPEQVQELLSKYRQYCNIPPGEAASPNPNPLEVKECELKPREEDLRLVLLGLPGAGKSSSGNTILGQDLFVSGGSFNHVTSEALARTAEVGGRRVTVVDTPGVPSEALSPRKLFDEIMRSIQLAAPGPHAFIIVVCIGRVTKADAEVFKLLPKMFDRDAPLFSIVLFTHADRLRNQRIQDLIRGNKAINLLVSKCGGRYCVFNNLQRDNRTQVHTLVTMVTAVVRENREYSSKMFSRVHLLPVEVSIQWHDLRDWFLEFIEELKQKFKSCDDVKYFAVGV